jgi:hypothetical protein
MNPEAVDEVMAQYDSEIKANIVPCRERVPVTVESMRNGIRRIIQSRMVIGGYTTHQACQEVATQVGRSYEWVREIYGDNPGVPERLSNEKYLAILEKTERYPLSDEDSAQAIRALASNSHGYTAHEVCQRIAICTKRSYEFVRKALDDQDRRTTW